MKGSIELGLNAVIIAVTDEQPSIITVRPRQGQEPALPFGPLDPTGHKTLERAVRSWVREQAGLELGYVEQLYTFGDRFRDPRERQEGPRSVSVGYLALVREEPLSGNWDALWTQWYDLFPWEDWRSTTHGARPSLLDTEIVPALKEWIDAAQTPKQHTVRRERVEIAFGLGSAGWDLERVLERYELLYEAKLVSEATRDAGLTTHHTPSFGRAMALDHRRMLATAMSRLRGKITYKPVVFELLSELFTLLHLQRLVEALSGVRIHKQNFRRLVDKHGLVEGTGQLDTQTGGRPAELFRFRREVLRERPASGVHLPGASHREAP